MNTNTGRFAVLRQLKADGIDCMFGNPGTSEQNLLDALSHSEFQDFNYYLGLQEGVVTAMGDSYARARQRPAIVQLHSYAGLANGLGMMYYARRGYTPMVVIAGEAGLRYEAMDAQMAADLVTMARPFVKSDYNGPCAWRVVHPESVVRLLRRAIKTAATPPMGPVFLTLPMDVLDMVNNEEIVPSLTIESRVTPDQATIARAAEWLAGASRPLFLIGDGIAAGNAQPELTKVAELLGAEVRGVNQSEVNMSLCHPCYAGDTGHMFGRSSRAITSAADVVLACGTTLMPEVFPETGNIFAAGARVIHFDLNTGEIGKNFPMSLGALAHPKPTLQLLATELERVLTKEQRATASQRLEQRRIEKSKRIENQRASDATRFGQTPMRGAGEFARQLAERLQGSGTPFAIFDEALTHSPDITQYFTFDQPGMYFQTRAGMLGTGLPGAVGLKVAYPDRHVFGFSGDGGSMQTIQALSTAARHGIGAKFVVCNNRSYRILKYNLQEYWRDLSQPTDQIFPTSFSLDQPELRFDKLAEAQGVRAIRVEEPKQIPAAIDEALADDRPFLIDLVLSSDL